MQRKVEVKATICKKDICLAGPNYPFAVVFKSPTEKIAGTLDKPLNISSSEHKHTPINLISFQVPYEATFLGFDDLELTGHHSQFKGIYVWKFQCCTSWKERSWCPYRNFGRIYKSLVTPKRIFYSGVMWRKHRTTSSAVSSGVTNEKFVHRTAKYDACNRISAMPMLKRGHFQSRGPRNSLKAVFPTYKENRIISFE